MNLRISNLNLLPKTKFLIQCQPQSSQSSQQKFLSYARKEILRNKHQSKISSQCQFQPLKTSQRIQTRCPFLNHKEIRRLITRQQIIKTSFQLLKIKTNRSQKIRVSQLKIKRALQLLRKKINQNQFQRIRKRRKRAMRQLNKIKEISKTTLMIYSVKTKIRGQCNKTKENNSKLTLRIQSKSKRIFKFLKIWIKYNQIKRINQGRRQILHQQNKIKK